LGAVSQRAKDTERGRERQAATAGCGGMRRIEALVKSAVLDPSTPPNFVYAGVCLMPYINLVVYQANGMNYQQIGILAALKVRFF
jgi:hypothetical protein